MRLFKKGGGGADPRSSIVNSAKTFLANVRFLSVDDPVHTIVLTSAVPNEGKTFVTANLASAIATSGQTVLLVECDMRRRSMASSLGVHARHGIYEVLSSSKISDQDILAAAITTDIPNLYFLDAEPHLPNPSDILNSERFTRFIHVAASMYDYVVFDTPPVGTFVDAAVLGTKVDAVFMVVREGFTKKQEVADAAEQLRKSGCNLAGVVMNYCARRDSEYYYEYYYTKTGHDDSNAPGNTGFISPTGGVTGPSEKSAAPRTIETEHKPTTHLPSRPERPQRAQKAAKRGVPESTGAEYSSTRSASVATPMTATTPASSTPAGSTHATNEIMDTNAYAALAELSRRTHAEEQYVDISEQSTASFVPYIPSRREDDF